VRPGAPREVVERLNQALQQAARQPEVRNRLAALALEPEAMSAQAFGAVIAAESEKWLAIARAANIKAD
jgi:tripartite-type tricarboxylate transporter receptor subunit TctC